MGIGCCAEFGATGGGSVHAAVMPVAPHTQERQT